MSIPVMAVASIIISGLLFMTLTILSRAERPEEPVPEFAAPSVVHPQAPKPPEPVQGIQEPLPTPPSLARTARSEMPKPEPVLSSINLEISRDLAGLAAIAPWDKRMGIPMADLDGPVSLEEVDRPPELVRHLPPLYPLAAKRKGIQGQVIIRLVVDKAGEVQSPEILEAIPRGIFERAALTAVKRWRFAPAVKDTNAVDVVVVIPLKFELVR